MQTACTFFRVDTFKQQINDEKKKKKKEEKKKKKKKKLFSFQLVHFSTEERDRSRDSINTFMRNVRDVSCLIQDSSK